MTINDGVLHFARLVKRVGAATSRYRAPITVTALAVLLGGIVYSVDRLALDPSRLDWKALGLLAGILVPVTLCHAAWGMVLLGRCAQLSLRWTTGLRVSALAVVAEVLPLPGGAMIRTGALVGAGGGVGMSTALVTGTAILWIALSSFGAGMVLRPEDSLVGLIIALTGFAASAAILAWLARTGGAAAALETLIHRVIGLFLIAVRLHLSFAVVGALVRLDETLPFAFATIAGTASSLVPGGLGISELFAALIANFTMVEPATALLGVALNRLVGLAVTALIVCAFEGRAVFAQGTSYA